MDKFTGIISIPSRGSTTETIDRLQAALLAKGVTIYGRIDQQAEAKKAGLVLAPVELLIFGNPGGGVPLMAAEPLAALDLPLKALAWEDPGGKVWLSYNDFAYLRERYGLAEDLVGAVAGVEKLFKSIVL